MSHPFTYKSKFETLHHEAEQLMNKRLKLQQSVDGAKRKGEEIYESVDKWLIEAGKAIEEADEFIQGEEQAKKRCFVGLCPDLKTRYLLSKKAEKKALAIDKLVNEGDHDPISFRPRILQIVASSVYHREALNSRVLFLKQVMDALRDPNLNKIGVHGMGGVGNHPSKRGPQASYRREAIRRGGYGCSESNTRTPKNSIGVGIPIGDDCKGCKILLTSRDKHVLSQMGTQVVFHLDVLQDEEAWSLFEMTLADAKDSELPPIATEVAKKCAGLPLLLLTVATDLRNRESYAWNDKLKQLSVFDNEEIYAKVHSVLESSYNDLPGNEVKSFFLLCGLLGLSNIPIRSLLKYVMGLSLFKHISTVKEARNNVYTLIDTLKAKCLLIDGDKYGFVKIHDVVRDTALLIASREQHAFIGTRSGSELMKWPNKDSARISLPYCDIEDLPEGWECPKAELLLLFTEVLSLGIPDLFFKGIRNLEVVDFTGMRFVSLPSSLAFLSNLHTLCLHRCQLDDIAIIGDLKQLRVLSFANSYIVELPRQIEELTRLKLLDVSDCSKLKMIPASALSKLSQLEALYMSNSFDQWEADGIRNQGNASLAELEYLSHLMTLEIQILDAKILPKRLFSNGLQSYRILIGYGWDWNGNYETSRMLKLKLKTSIHSEYGVKVLLRETEDLYLDEVRGAENVLYDIDGDGFPQLKHLHVQNNTVIQHIINSTKCAACDAFPILESLILKSLMNLEKICHGQLAAGSFNKLGILKMKKDSKEEVVEFNQLRSLTLGILPHLRSFRSKMKKAPPGIESRHKQILTADEPAFEEFLSEGEHGAQSSLFNRMVAFSNLENLNLWEMNDIKSLWQSQLAADSFCKLKSLEIYRCSKLMTVFPSNVLERFQRLEELNVRNCNSLQEIYQLEGSNVIEAFELRKLSIQSLPSLKHVWRKDPQGVFTFQNLKSVEVSNCDVLKNLFPASIAESLLQLENLTIIKCGVEEIVAKPEDVESAPYYCFKFPQLTSLKLIELSELRSFYPGTHISEWQKLKCLEVRNCRKVRKFGLEEVHEEGQHSIPIQQPLLLLEKMSPNLEELTLEHKDLIAIQHGQFSFQHFSKLKVLTLSNLQNRSQLFLIGFLKTVHYVETIVVKSSNLEESFSCEGFTLVRNLELFAVDNLKQIWDEDSRLKLVLPHLKTLSVKHCNSLTNIVPSSSSFPNLATLEVSFCDGLVNLITASTAKTMVQLTKMTVSRCNKITEIVTSDGDDHTEDEITFRKLQILELTYLSSLISFCSGNHAFNFPSLENVRVFECSQMKIFSFGVLNTPKLRGIKLANQQHWEGNLNATIGPSQLEVRPYFQASKFPELWHGGIQGRLFHNVQSLTVDQCAISDIPVPANLLQFLKKLEKLQVEYCYSAEIVFDLEGLSVDDGHTELLPQLSKLHLANLPMLRHLWNKDPLGILEFNNLRLLHVENCNSLKNIFTWSTALCLMQLEEIKLSNCNTIEEIIEKEGPEEATSSADKMILPSLKFVDLECLPKFSSFYSGSSNLECLSLKKLSIYECPSMKNVFGTLLRLHRPNTNDEGREQRLDNEGFDTPLITPFYHKMFPNLEDLSLDKKSAITILQSQFPTDFFSQVKVLHLRCFPNKSLVPLFSLLPGFPNLQNLVVLDSSLKQLFPFEGFVGDQEDITTLPRIRALKLKNLDDLKHVWESDCQLHNPLFQSLEDLEIESCGNLIFLVPSSASFRNLKALEVSECNALINIVTSSTAKSMVQLETLTVKSCNMLTEIVGGDQGVGIGSTDEIVFSKMKTLHLEDLQSLTSFCLGSYTFNFPSLEQLTLHKCPKLRIFTAGVSSTPKLRGVWAGFPRSNWRWEGNLNANIEQLHMKYVGFEGIDDVQLSNFPMLKEKWHGQFPFKNLKHLRKLVVDDCAFFSNAVSSNLLKYLFLSNQPVIFYPKSKNGLVVERCDSVEELFDLEGLNADEGDVGLLKYLNELRLIDLPRLRHVWNDDPQGILSFKNLTFLQVQNCSSLTNIFTLSMASGLVNLQHMELKRCSLVEHIITKEAGEEIVKDKIIFPSMKSISLESLPY
ncbi:hypothetical protein GH714_011927 [Hevea brasiliensis]|uniref:Uncharacterized protein n=1 Tax=Hevea brasiliensis TaxID=3981 RepID=A0A6A6KZI9_HEVBR|nr:hypothetical protein GH714_011927 [Hevea brasiliensis]